ncbi:MAG: hypothetical protein JRD68_05250 [Deltaproteobacteria bacterium]|nr:hypothetical protein [Deltaproteobacteria bacterium]
MKILIRDLAEDDIAPVIELWEEVGDYHDYLDSPQALLEKARLERDLFLVAETDGRVIGTVMGGQTKSAVMFGLHCLDNIGYLFPKRLLYPPPWAVGTVLRPGWPWQLTIAGKAWPES